MTKKNLKKLVSDLANEQPNTELAHEGLDVLLRFATRLLEETALTIKLGKNGIVVITPQGGASKTYRHNGNTNTWEQIQWSTP